MNYHVVTTMNEAGWIETGRRMVESFATRWPKNARLTLYAEGFIPNAAVATRPLPVWLDEFKAKHRNTRSANGWRKERYTYTHDAVKFAHKVAALTDFAEGIRDGVVIWLDADVYTHADVTEQWLTKLFPEPAYIAWLDRQNTHPECGFVMFRASHPYHAAFMDRFRALYTSGRVFDLPETHDSFVLQHLVTAKVATGHIPAPASLSGEALRTSHPAVNGPLGACIDHMKGPRKAEGRSRRRDLIRPRSEPYWRT